MLKRTAYDYKFRTLMVETYFNLFLGEKYTGNTLCQQQESRCLRKAQIINRSQRHFRLTKLLETDKCGGKTSLSELLGSKQSRGSPNQRLPFVRLFANAEFFDQFTILLQIRSRKILQQLLALAY